MAHCIETEDRGYVWGTTWHNLPQYKQLDRPVTYEEALEVADFPLEKAPLFSRVRIGEITRWMPRDAWEIVRTDTGRVLVDHVGARFEILNNTELLQFVKTALLDRYKGLEIESIGTLSGGATLFVNLKLDEHRIKGDDSPTVSRLMYYNPLGGGSAGAGLHTVRIVCNNTLSVAKGEAAANKTLKKFRHTASVGERMQDYIVDLAEVKLKLEKHKEKMEILAAKDVTQELFDNYFQFLFPVAKDASQAATTRAANRRELVMFNFNKDQKLSSSIKNSRYALLQATTDYFDHQEPREGSDVATIAWNGLVGDKAAVKAAATKWLLTA